MAFDMMGMMWGLIGVTIVFYVYSALALMYIGKRTNAENPWMAWIPIANIYLMTKIAGIHPAWTLAFLLAFIPLVGSFLMLIIMIYFWWKIAEVRNKPGWWGILMAVPIVNLVIMGILAWGE